MKNYIEASKNSKISNVVQYCWKRIGMLKLE